jgi:hypothetical protein
MWSAITPTLKTAVRARALHIKSSAFLRFFYVGTIWNCLAGFGALFWLWWWLK